MYSQLTNFPEEQANQSKIQRCHCDQKVLTNVENLHTSSSLRDKAPFDWLTKSDTKLLLKQATKV